MPFTTVEQYLAGLEALALLTRRVSGDQEWKLPIFYLPAAVSDFYLPADALAEHKI